MIERLQRALEHIEELPPEAQEEIAEQIEMYTDTEPTSEPHARGSSLAGAWRDLPDDMEETLMRWRRESKPTPPIEEQLAWMDDNEGQK